MKKESFIQKKQRKHDAAFISVLSCLLAMTPILCWGDGITQGYSLLEIGMGIISFSIVAGIGYLIGYFLPIRRWMNKGDQLDEQR